VLPKAPSTDKSRATPPNIACSEKMARPSAKTAAEPDVACRE
jgi:hypothetical protein